MTSSNIGRIQGMKRNKQNKVDTEHDQLTQSRAAKRKKIKLAKKQSTSNKTAIQTVGA